MFAAITIQQEMNPILVICLSLALGALIGLFNGLMVVKVRVTAFLATLVTMSVLKGCH